MPTSSQIPIETHPWNPFVPDGARVLIMGTFPPQAKRWSMDFYYPNRTNDFWYMMGVIFFGHREALLMPDGKRFNLEAIKRLLTEKGIALSDTGHRIRRLQGNASDKFLEIVEPVNLRGLIDIMPHLRDIATTGEKAASVIAELTATSLPRIGEWVEGPERIKIWRMPSTSRAYPLALEKKADVYRHLFQSAGIID